MAILHAFLALFAGFAAMAVILVVATAALTRLAPEWAGEPGQPRAAYVLANLGYSLAAAIVGGYITAWSASDNPLRHALTLAIIVLLLAALSALQQRGRQPIWYQLLLMAITPAGVLLGGFLRIKIAGA